MRIRAWLALWAVLAIGGCSAQSAQLTACKASADDGDRQQAKLAACMLLVVVPLSRICLLVLDMQWLLVMAPSSLLRS